MKNITEILAEMGIQVEDQEALTKAVAENYVTRAEHDKKIGRLEGERDQLKAAADAANETLEKLGGKTPEDITKELAEFRKRAENAEKDYAAKIAKRDFDDALRNAIDGIKFTSEAAKRAVREEIEAAGLQFRDGKILGLGDLIGQIREKDATAFVDEDKARQEAEKAKFTDKMSGGKVPESAFAKMALAEKMDYANKHPDAPEVAAWLKS